MGSVERERVLQRQQTALAAARALLDEPELLTTASAANVIEKLLRAAAAGGVALKPLAAELSIRFSDKRSVLVHDGRGKILGVTGDEDLADLWTRRLHDKGRRAHTSPITRVRIGPDGLYRPT